MIKMSKRKINIACFGNIYSLLVYLLITNRTLRKETLFILENLRMILPYKAFTFKGKHSYFLEFFLVVIIFFAKLIIKNNILIYGQDHLLIGNKLLLFKNFYLIEDGSMSYSTILVDYFAKRQGIKKIIDTIFQRKKMLGRDSAVKKIYLTGLAPIPEEIKDKVEIINLKELWNKKSDVEKEEILNIFGFDKNIVNNIKNRKYILYTQPLSEDEILLENEKIELYSKILKKYNENYIVLKKHPREKTDYKKIFPDIEVMDQVFPAELLTLLDIHFEKAITIFSTAALTDDKVQVDFYGTEVHPKLFQEFGSQDIIMRRNAFLDEEEKK